MGVVLVTGSGGLVGSECVRHFAALGHAVVGMDSNARKDFFGEDGNVRPTITRLIAEVPAYKHHKTDIRDRATVLKLVSIIKPSLVIHAAAQPSHDLAAARPFDDFEVNCAGTLNLLEACRRSCPDSPFVFLSTNKVYGDAFNNRLIYEDETRYEFEFEEQQKGIDEKMPVDATTHSLVGCSKLAADLYVQEYGRYFGMPTVCFRAGCLTGSAQAGAEQHGFLAYLAKCLKEGRSYTVFGHKGKQVRDNLHAHDVALACEHYAAAPRPAEVYNLGGGWDNACSVLEAITLMEQATGKKLAWNYNDTPRKGDHVVYYSDLTKFKAHYPKWSVTRSLKSIVEELTGDTLKNNSLPSIIEEPCKN